VTETASPFANGKYILFFIKKINLSYQ